MAKITSLPDEIVEHILQCVYDSAVHPRRDWIFLQLVHAFPRWIPILLDCRFINASGQRSPRFEDVWGYRHRIYLDQNSGLWMARDSGWQPHGVNVTAWKCRNGDSSYVESGDGEVVAEEETVEEVVDSNTREPGNGHSRDRGITLNAQAKFKNTKRSIRTALILHFSGFLKA